MSLLPQVAAEPTPFAGAHSGPQGLHSRMHSATCSQQPASQSAASQQPGSSSFPIAPSLPLWADCSRRMPNRFGRTTLAYAWLCCLFWLIYIYIYTYIYIYPHPLPLPPPSFPSLPISYNLKGTNCSTGALHRFCRTTFAFYVGMLYFFAGHSHPHLSLSLSVSLSLSDGVPVVGPPRSGASCVQT